MKPKLQKYYEQIKIDHVVFLNFLKATFPVFHNSNFFFRDFHYGVRKYLEKKGNKISYSDSEEIARELGKYFEGEGIFVKIDAQSWKVNYPEFVTTEPGDPL